MPSWMQKDRPQTFKVRPITSIKRATSIMARLHAGRAWSPRALTMLVRLCAAQASDHAWRARTASLGRAAVGVATRGCALGACGRVAFLHLTHGSTRLNTAARGSSPSVRRRPTRRMCELWSCGILAWVLAWLAPSLVGGGAAGIDASSAISELYHGRSLLATNSIVDIDVFHVAMCIARY